MWPFTRSVPLAEHESCSSEIEALSERVQKLEHGAMERELLLSELLDKVSWRLRERAAKRIQKTEEPSPAAPDGVPGEGVATPSLAASNHMPFRSRRPF
jgi:hypothetical protein